jgi:hypothetical protein
MDVEYLKNEQRLIEEYIDRFCDKTTETAAPISDGIVNVEKYLKSKYRICWVLKEPYDGEGGQGGEWSLTGDVLNKENLYSEVVKNSPTWQPMVYITYSLLNGFIRYRDMEYIRDEPQMAQCLTEIALINVSKMPAARRSNDADIANKYIYWKPILHWQLKQYDPQIIIFGNTFQHFQKDLNIKKEDMICKDYVDYVIRDNKIYAHVYHPAQTSISREEYVQRIIDVIKSFADGV